MKPITALYLSHRWFGIAMCLFIAMWCFSGVVMMYIGFPQMTKDEYYAGLQPLAAEQIQTSPQALLKHAPQNSNIEQLLLTSSAQRPIFLMKTSAAAWQGMYADTGELIIDLGKDQIVSIAEDFYRTQHASQSHIGLHQEQLEMDQWSVSSGLNPYRPLHRVSINDEIGTELYISALTGQVVRDTHRSERIWNWLGANLHWIYPMQLRKHRDLWVGVIIVLCLAGLFSVITGAIIGVKRLRLKRRYRSGAVTPYRGIAKYHHLLGLFSVIFLFTFLFSGLMSVGPWGIFNSNTSFTEQKLRYQQQPESLNSKLIYAQPDAIKQLLRQYASTPIKQIAWHWIGGQAYVTLHTTKQDVKTVFSPESSEKLQAKINLAMPSLIPTSEIVQQQKLSHYDLYYYSRHNSHRPLPIARVKFNDPESTWFHIDLTSGEILSRLTSKDRVARWIYNGLHTFDFTFLIYNRPAWDILLIFLCGFGLLFSVTSVVIGVRYLKR